MYLMLCGIQGLIMGDYKWIHECIESTVRVTSHVWSAVGCPVCMQGMIGSKLV